MNQIKMLWANLEPKQKKMSIGVILLAMLIVFAINMNPATTEVKAGLDRGIMSASVKDDHLTMDPSDKKEERVIYYARNILVRFSNDPEPVITGEGSVKVTGNNTGTYTEDGVIISLNNLGVGEIGVTVTDGETTVDLSFTAEEKGPDADATYGGKAYAAGVTNDSSRDIRDENKGYTEVVVDDNGNAVGHVSRDEISGTHESQQKVEEINKGAGETAIDLDEWYSKPSSKPTVETKPVEEPAPTPVIPAEKEPVDTSKNEVDKDSVMQEATNVANEQNTSISTACAKFVILPPDGSDAIIYFGNGSGDIVVENASVTDLGNGFVSIAGYSGVFKK